jgi:hypothetical protein
MWNAVPLTVQIFHQESLNICLVSRDIIGSRKTAVCNAVALSQNAAPIHILRCCVDRLENELLSENYGVYYIEEIDNVQTSEITSITEAKFDSSAVEVFKLAEAGAGRSVFDFSMLSRLPRLFLSGKPSSIRRGHRKFLEHHEKRRLLSSTFPC